MNTILQTDVAIIGGGIVGAGIFRELSLHDIPSMLFDAFDFCSQTSQGSSKMLHGGIRYLENLDFALVHEALEEKNLWLKLAPHLVKSASFHLPVYQDSKYPLPFVRLGLGLYDLLSRFKNEPHQHANAEIVSKRFPQLKTENLRGAGIYHDAIVDDHKLGLDCIYDALNSNKSYAHNYHEIIECIFNDDGAELTAKDKITGDIKKIRAKYVVFSTGPFTDNLMKQLKIPWKNCIRPSKGIHLWIRPESLNLWGPVVLNLKDGRVIFVIPQRHAILVGTTENLLPTSELNTEATQKEIDYLLNCLKEFFPKSQISQKDILSTTSAIRPLVIEDETETNLGKISRVHKVIKPNSKSYVILGGKYTTFRRMAQDICKELIPRLGMIYYPNLTLSPLKTVSLHQTFLDTPITESLVTKIIQEEHCKNFEDLYYRRLSQINKAEHVAGKSRDEWNKLITITNDKKKHSLI